MGLSHKHREKTLFKFTEDTVRAKKGSNSAAFFRSATFNVWIWTLLQ